MDLCTPTSSLTSDSSGVVQPGQARSQMVCRSGFVFTCRIENLPTVRPLISSVGHDAG